ncbi:MAG: transglutaminase family protein [Rhizomicrobium sp.]
MRLLSSLAVGFLGVILFTPTQASHPAHKITPDAINVIRAVFKTPDDALDLAKAKLTFDKIVDPAIDVDATLRLIDQMAQTVGAMAGPNASEIQRLAAVRRFIYVDGDWNGHRPFQYDLDDPLGTKITDKLLPNYVASRRGNCISMPILFIILADRQGLNVTASMAPLHVFARFTNGTTGKTYNLETTSGGLPEPDAWYREKLPMSDEAVKNGVYMKTLTKKETVAVMAEVLLEYFIKEKRYRETIDTADIMLKYYPNFVSAMLLKGTAYAGLIDTEFRQKYPTENDIPSALHMTYQSYVDENQHAFEKAEALGWRETDGELAGAQQTDR